MSIIGRADDPPMRVGNVVGDMLAGMNAFQGILLGLRQVENGAGCQRINVSLLESILAFQTPTFTEYLMTGVLPNVPGLLGLPRDYLNAQMGAWRAGKRRAHAPDCMAQVALRMSPDDIQAVTVWLASQPVPSDSKPAERLAAVAGQPVCGTAAIPASATSAKTCVAR
jgi:hypothetical protein